MRIQYPANSQRYWVDRNLAAKPIAPLQGALPTTPQNPATLYTVPANRKFMLATVTMFVWRNTVATTLGQNQFAIAIKSGASITQVAYLIYVNNTQYSTGLLNQAMEVYLNAGDQVLAYCITTDTGGQVYYDLEVTGSEFDA